VASQTRHTKTHSSLPPFKTSYGKTHLGIIGLSLSLSFLLLLLLLLLLILSPLASPRLPVSDHLLRVQSFFSLFSLSLSTSLKRLEALDPVYARTLHRNDYYRLGRALSIIKITGRAVSSFGFGKTCMYTSHSFIHSVHAFPSSPFTLHPTLLQPHLPSLTTAVCSSSRTGSH